MAITALSALIGLAAVAPAVQGLTHYPPSNNSNYNLAWAINGTGPPGFFNSSQTPDSEYGYYNWCQMPHVRASEYVKPSSEYKLQYVEVIQRHHKRTPYASNTFFKEDIPWNCSGNGPFAGGRDANGVKTTQIYWQAQHGSLNPFEYTEGPGFINSTCQFPMITSEGLEDAKQHGQDFYGVYGEMLQFLPLAHEKHKYQWRVSNNVITSQTLSGFAAGIYPEIDEYSAYQQNADYDSLAPAFSCPLASKVQSANEGTNPAWVIHLNQTAALRARFNNVSGIPPDDTGGWNTSWDHPFDNLSAKQCHQKPLPCSVNNTAICVSQTDADAIYRIGQWEYAYRWRGAANSTLLASLKFSPWVLELKGHIQASLDGTSPVKYTHNIAHDGSISPLLGMLQIDQPVWPGMGSEIVFEVWTKNSTPYIRVLWSGQPLKTSTPLGTLDMIKYSDFTEYLDDILVKDIVKVCNGS